MVKRLLFTIIFSPVLLVVVTLMFINNIKRKNFIKSLFLSLNMDIIDALNESEFTELIQIMLKQNGFTIENVHKTQKHSCLIISKKQKKAFVCLQFGCMNTLDELNLANVSKNCFNCDKAVIISNRCFSRDQIEKARKLNIKLLSRNDLEKIINLIKKKNKKEVQIELALI